VTLGSLILAGLLARNGLMSGQLALVSAGGVAPAIGGVLIGTRLALALSRQAFRRVMLLVLIVIAVSLIARMDQNLWRASAEPATASRIGWERLEQVSIVTNDRGPFADDVFWLLTDGETTIVITNDLPAVAALNERVCALPGARADQIVAAMGSTENATFAIWQREAR